ncbi:discoidin domain-containing protein [Planctomicrobium piriforme]|uniref:F5/8 type C domain-containing protein n=1 Tax=Planctomicrobium piriforme TaxID=1576369 RepID=A0A1I3B4Y0_9PLAN|nr:discoidin domain-containing protein [Planctomicrobium piriforme]SFH57146.1 F5/8 type C domain-containing protein [Planctomicrobium piriforme]
MSRALDDSLDASGWSPFASGQADLAVSSEGEPSCLTLRLDFDFKGESGFIGVRKEVDVLLPEAFAFRFRVRGDAPRNTLEFKLTDHTGQNVWRWQENQFEFPANGRDLILPSRDIEFAWGPAGGGRPRRLKQIEFVINAGSRPGGQGTVWFEDLTFENRTGRKPKVTSSSSARGSNLATLLSKKPAHGWWPTASDSSPWLQIDFHNIREYGGLLIEWNPKQDARKFTVEASDDGVHWERVYKSSHSSGGRSLFQLKNKESRYLRIALNGPAGIRRIEVMPFDIARSLDELLYAAAARSPKGRYPRYLFREQSYWTCAGIPDGETCGLINEDGLTEPDRGSFSLEPFLQVQEEFLTWADARRSVSLEADDLPIPSVTWSLPNVQLEVTAFATGHRSEATFFARYQVTNSTSRKQNIKLFVAIRPHQVTPPWQKWNSLGGVSEVHDIRWKQGAAWVNGAKAVIPLTEPTQFGGAPFEQGVISDLLAEKQFPESTHIHDEQGLASAALQFDLALAAGETQSIYVAVPFGDVPKADAGFVRRIKKMDGAEEFAAAVRLWQRRLNSVQFHTPPGVATEAARTFRTAAGQILINRDGPALQPGPRRYTRSWIRDGAIMGGALLRSGDNEALPEFAEWYAGYQREDGFVPCCVDRTGPDWLVEHDSHGEFIYSVMEAFRFTRDREFLQEMWPHMLLAAKFIESLRAQRLTAKYSRPDHKAMQGLLPESASHEGYLAQPVHSYWDDFWALRGLKDIAAAAKELGKAEPARHFAKLANAMHQSLRESIEKVIADRQLNYVPGSVEWADYDPTATANAVGLLQNQQDLPSKPLQAMFDLFVSDTLKKHRGEIPWNNYSAYEIRIIGALVRLGKRAEALELLGYYLDDRRPRPWNQWPEITWHKPRTPGHLGDLPHTWIAAEYMLAFASLFAYEREADDSLVIGAGVDADWINSKGGISITNFPTWYGRLDLGMIGVSAGKYRVSLGGSLVVPAGGFVLRLPISGPIQSVTVNDQAIAEFNEHEAVVRQLPADVKLQFAATTI